MHLLYSLLQILENCWYVSPKAFVFSRLKKFKFLSLLHKASAPAHPLLHPQLHPADCLLNLLLITGILGDWCTGRPNTDWNIPGVISWSLSKGENHFMFLLWLKAGAAWYIISCPHCQWAQFTQVKPTVKQDLHIFFHRVFPQPVNPQPV